MLVVLAGLIGAGCGNVSEPQPGESLHPGSQPVAQATSQSQETSSPWALRFRGAERVVVATVRQVSASHGMNEYGDALILSEITLEVHESLRGDAAHTATFHLEGGTVGDLTLTVSDLPRLVPGDRGVFALHRNPSSGMWLPHGRALGILLTPADADLEPIRQAVGASR